MFGFGKTAKWNKEDTQVMLVGIIFEAAMQSDLAKQLEVSDRVFYLQSQTGWTNKETADRVTYAALMIKSSFDRETYRKAKDIAKNLYITLHSV